MRWLVAIVALAVLGGAVRDSAREVRQGRKAFKERHANADRYVDMGVELRVVVQDDDGGEELLEGKPRMRVVRVHRRGGMVVVNRKVNGGRGRLVGPSRSPTVWYCSVQQEQVILHGKDLPLGILLYGSEGAGKSFAIAAWHFFRVLEHLGEGREGGCVAPTIPRLKFVRDAMLELYPKEWYRYRKSKDLFVFADGATDAASTRVQLVGAYRQSKEQGSPIQGFNWSWASGDEFQDFVARHSDLVSRGRSARHSQYKQLRSATAKDSFTWRTMRDKLVGSGLWRKLVLLIHDSPFIGQEFKDQLIKQHDARSYAQRVLAQDVGPERQLYHTWSRGEAPTWAGNVRRIPDNAIDVTAQVLKHWGPNLTVLVGYDPGKIYDVSILLKAYQMPWSFYTLDERRYFERKKTRPRHVWVVVGEVTTKSTTTEQHAVALLAYAQAKFGVNLVDWQGRAVEGGARMFVRADPYSDSGATDKKPDKSVYTTFRAYGVKILPAALQPRADEVKAGTVPKEGRIDVMCRLLCDADGERRLFVAANDNYEPVAPELVRSFEEMERNEAGQAETEDKGVDDRSHWPCAGGYALWTLEKPTIAMKEAA